MNDTKMNDEVAYYKAKLEESLETSRQLRGTIYDLNQTLIHVEEKFKRFKETVAKEVVSWPYGCEQGKRDFLIACDLELPQETFSITLSLTTEYGLEMDDLYTLVEERLKDSDFEIENIKYEGVNV